MARANKFLPIVVALFLIACQENNNVNEEKVLNLPLITNIKTFDPALSGDGYSSIGVSMVYEPLYQYAYLQRPITVEPNLAQSLPTVSTDRMIYDIAIQQGVFFVDDPAFTSTQGKGRELTAADVVYTLKRIADSKTKSTGWWLLDKHIKGLNDFRIASEKKTPTDYALPVDGLAETGRYSLRIKLTTPFNGLLYALAHPQLSIVAHEAVDYYGAELGMHPVGTGPFQLVQMARDVEYVFKRHPKYRLALYPSSGEPTDRQNGYLQAAGKRIPFLDKVVVKVYRESLPRWLNFMQGNIDTSDIPKEYYDKIIMDKKGNKELTQEFVDKGLKFLKSVDLDLAYIGFNMKDPLLGKNKNLRKALSLAFDSGRYVDIAFNGRATAAQSPIPPGLSGYDPEFKNPYRQYNLTLAKEYLAKAGYPEGKGLPTLTVFTVLDTNTQQVTQLLRDDWQKLGVKIKFENRPWGEFLTRVNQGQAPIFFTAWAADYPDADNFLALFYGGFAAPGVNSVNYQNPEFDKLFEQARLLVDSPERTALYKQMVEILTEDVPAIVNVHRLRFTPFHGWLRNYKLHPIRHSMFKYYDIDVEAKRKLKAKL